MLANPRWPMNVSDGSHLFLISSHFFRAESVITCTSVSHRNSGVSHKIMHSYGRSYLGHPVLRVEVCCVHATGNLVSFLVCVQEPLVHEGVAVGVFPAQHGRDVAFLRQAQSLVFLVRVVVDRDKGCRRKT